jgi:hypothetical protein
MCDYSLMTVPNRLAANGEELIVHRFQEGSIGLASASEIRLEQASRKLRLQGFWPKLKEFFRPKAEGIPAVCIPPGSRLLIRDIPQNVHGEWGVQKSVAEAVFTQVTAEEFRHRDAVCFGSGTIVLLQRLMEGQRVRVVSVSSEEELQTEPEFGISERMR